jgi:hypothetical protein
METKKFVWVGFVVVLVMLAGCCGPGELTKIAVNMPGEHGGKATIVAHNQWAPDYLLDRKKLAFNYMVKGDVSEEQSAAIDKGERGCRIYAGTVRPSNFVTVLSDAGLLALLSGGGVALGARAFSPAVHTNQYGAYGAGAGGGAGTASGIMSLGGQTYTFENCGSNLFALFPGYEIRILQKSPY